MNRKWKEVGKVSTKFEFFPSGFVFELGLALEMIGLYAEFNSASSDTNFN